ncbi:hydantoinase/oxoprolinase family protein, partial [Candidatus Poribacteria bacterium]
MGVKVGVDIGGTFTDVVAIDEGGIHAYKLLSTPDRPDKAVLKGVEELLRRLGRSPSEAEIVHGTTVGLNALLERRGARTALVTTKGFEDILEIGRQTRPELYNFFVDRPPPLVPPELRFGVEERVLHDGRVEKEVDSEEVERLADELLRLGVESVAICFLFSFLNPENELKVREILRGKGIEAFASFEILPEYREYERMSTTVANAYVAPILARYLDRLEGELGRVFVMSSAGGTISSGAAKRRPIMTILSGPVGGVIGGSFFAGKAGFKRVITFDMGGTSTDVSL